MNDSQKLKSILHKENLRFTNQRLEIWEEISDSTEHSDAEDIYNSLRKRKINDSRAIW